MTVQNVHRVSKRQKRHTGEHVRASFPCTAAHDRLHVDSHHPPPPTTLKYAQRLMEGNASERESPTLRIDPKWYVRHTILPASLTAEHSIQDALRSFFQPIKTDDPRLDFYTMYRREAMEYDTDYVKKYDEDLNTTLIFVRYCIPFRNLSHLSP